MKIVNASLDNKDNRSENFEQELMNAYDMLAAFFAQVTFKILTRIVFHSPIPMITSDCGPIGTY